MTFKPIPKWWLPHFDAIPTPPRPKPVGQTINDFMSRTAITKQELAWKMNMDASRLEQLLDGAIRLTPMDAIKLERVFGLNAISWLGHQSDTDLYNARVIKLFFRRMP